MISRVKNVSLKTALRKSFVRFVGIWSVDEQLRPRGPFTHVAGVWPATSTVNPFLTRL